MFERTKSGIRHALMSFLNIHEADGLHVQINELLDFDGNAFANSIWYRGDSYELEQFYSSVPEYGNSFWGADVTPGMEIRRVHTGLPRIMVNTLTSMVSDDCQGVDIAQSDKAATWEDVERDSDFDKLLKKAIKKCLVTGDGAFKLSIDTDVTNLPIIEFYEADRIELRRKRGRISEIIFKTLYHNKGKTYILKERYGYGYITYELVDKYDTAYTLDTLEQTKDLVPVYFDTRLLMAEYMSFYESDKWEGRGQSVFDSKRDNFDALDEAWSQWVDALRANRTKTYIPEDLLPRDPNSGMIMRGNSFDNRFIRTNTPMQEGAQSKIVTEQGAIAHDSYLATYVTALDLCLQGIISPSTLGIDVKKLDNAEAQREKEKATLYTRQTIVTAIQDAIPHLVDKVFKTLALMNQTSLEDTECEIGFGEYANPSFESQIETVGKAKTSGVMSTEAVVEELYGDSKTDEWKREEVRRIKEEQGIAELGEPSMQDDAFLNV